MSNLKNLLGGVAGPAKGGRKKQEGNTMRRSLMWALVLMGLVGSELGWARSTLTLSGSDNDRQGKDGLVFPQSAQAGFLDPGDYNYGITPDGVMFGRYFGKGGSVTIPSEIGGLPVTGVFWNSFGGVTGLTEVIIPNTVKNLGMYRSDGPTGDFRYGAFRGCTGLTNVVIPDSVTEIGFNAFRDCTNLTAVYIGKSLASAQNFVFQGCTALTNVTIPGSLTQIPWRMFSGCTSLQSAVIEEGVLQVGSEAFNSCTRLSKVVLPQTLGEISSLAFSQCRELAEVAFPGHLGYIASAAFNGCVSLKSIELPSTVMISESGAFYGCTGLTNVFIADGPKYLGGLWLGGCTSLSTVRLPNTLLQLGDSAFSGCTSLGQLTIPASVERLNGRVFLDCSSLTNVYFKGNCPITNLYDFVKSTPTIYYLPDMTGWTNTFADRPAVLWNPTLQATRISSEGLNLTITGTTNIPILLEANTNLTSPLWVPLLTTNLSAGSLSFTDPGWTNSSARFYRVRSP